jgi:hypothetical protein
MRPDARPQARKNRRRTRWNTLRIFQDRERCGWYRIVRRSRTVNAGQAPRNRSFSNAVVGYRGHRRIECGSVSAGIGAGQLFNPGYGEGMHHA